MKTATILLLIGITLGCNTFTKDEKTSIADRERSSAECIDRIFEQDSVLGSIRNHDSEQLSLSKTIDKYTGEAESFDFTNCPQEFQAAFYKHINAWRDFKILADKYPSLRGELHDVFAIIEKGKDSIEYKARLNDIFETWNIVEKNANR